MNNKHSAVVDHGNTHIKLAIFNEDKELVIKEFLDDFDPIVLKGILNKYKVSKSIYGATGRRDQNVIDVLQEHGKFIEFTTDIDLPIVVDYDTEETLGIDRIANACGAQLFYPDENILVIDIGTCITYDFIDTEGRFSGGAISPGPKLRAKSMNDYTASLPLVEPENEVSLIGKSTKSCLESGVYNGIVLEIEGFADRLLKEKKQLTIILTGGYTSLFVNAVKKPIFADSNFTLKGLNEILLYHVK